LERFHFQRIVRAAIATAMRGYFSLWDSHGGTIPQINMCLGDKNCAPGVSIDAFTATDPTTQGES